ncbi:PLP-dependent aminotransferase family protein [Oenococcus sicerae]|uniref:aminotransferase-like domain-containing protein n=1 Tax=Oenococcus sicerae TaxID=2203724 RepID=UPI0010B514F7|nr:Aromatic-amino-acid aminotransferase 1 [Oenococcus sicerae]
MNHVASRVQRTSNSGLDKLFQTAKADQIIFSAGYPDANLFPQKALAQAAATTFTTSSQNLLQYKNSLGLASLREKLVARTADKDNIKTDATHVMLTQGAQQGIDLAARLMLNENDGLIVEGPTYIGALAAFQAYEPTFYEVPIETDGMNVEILEKILKQHNIKMIYTVPDFQNPTGAVMSLAKRQRVLELANEYDVVILEDGTYRDLRYSGESLPTIKSFDTQGRVIYVSSFSKIIAPSLRLGWLTAEDHLFKDLLNLKSAADIESSNLTMSILNEYLEENELDDHIEILKNNYREKKNAMIQAMKAYMPSDAKFTDPQGGFFVWLTMPADFDMDQFSDQQLINTNVRFTPSTNLYPSGSIKNGARINFTGESISNIKLGIQKLGEALSQAWQDQTVNA